MIYQKPILVHCFVSGLWAVEIFSLTYQKPEKSHDYIVIIRRVSLFQLLYGLLSQLVSMHVYFLSWNPLKEYFFSIYF